MARVAVIGAGTMGHALALVFALGDHEVRLTDSAPATLELAQELMETALDTLVQFGEVPPERTPGWLQSAVSRQGSLAETVSGAELIIEAIVERADAKQVLYAELDAVAPAEAIWASNTSYLDVFPLIPEGRQRRAMITHWYTPPYLVDLCDLVPGPRCDPSVVEQVRCMVADMGKVPIVIRKFVPGYVANRVQSAIQAEVLKLLDEGVGTASEIDAAIIHGLALRLPILGILAKADFSGLQIGYDAARSRGSEPPKAVAAGHQGITKVESHCRAAPSRLIEHSLSVPIDNAISWGCEASRPQLIWLAGMNSWLSPQVIATASPT